MSFFLCRVKKMMGLLWMKLGLEKWKIKTFQRGDTEMPWQNKRVFLVRNDVMFEEEFKTRSKPDNQTMLGFTSFSSNLRHTTVDFDFLKKQQSDLPAEIQLWGCRARRQAQQYPGSERISISCLGIGR